MKNASQYRALASLCRQQAAYKPDLSWQLLAQAERWEHLAAEAISNHFNECNMAKSGNAPGENDILRATLVAAA